MWIRPSTPTDRDPLLDIWIRSVRATHTFLAESDIESLLPAVRDYLSSPESELWTLCSDRPTPIGFIGLADNNVESLFVAPEHARCGGGRLLLEHARRLKGPLRVDVNEQNPEAVRFYEANGFHVIGRSPVDDAGRPFPLLHLREGVS
jgi:putative acetyltransferase